MTESMSLMTAQITFLSPHLSIVHIPNEFYHFFIQPIFRILFGDDLDEDAVSAPWTDRHEFLNISITPVGCSIICSRFLVQKYLVPLVEQFNSLLGHVKTKLRPATIDISSEEYVVIQVDGEGLDAGQRVLELTAPLAMAGISIFFITTYFSDYILVPSRSRQIVLTTLQQRGFVFSPEAEAYISQLSPALHHQNNYASRDRPLTASSSGSEGQRPPSSSIPSTPPAKDIPELQVRTFSKLMKNNIVPLVDQGLRLVNCAGNRQPSPESIRQLKEDLMQVLLASGSHANPSKPTSNGNGTAHSHHRNHNHSNGLGLSMEDLKLDHPPDLAASFLSVTLSTEPVSILMEEKLLPRLGSTLLASTSEEDVLTPIVLDLRSLGWLATGIVGGVAGRLYQGPVSQQLEENGRQDGPVEISFLSSAKAGSVIVQANQLDRALKALEIGMEEVKARK